MVTFRLRGQDKLRDLSRALRRAADKDLRNELIAALKNANEPMTRRLKRAFANAAIRGFRTGSPKRFTKVIPSKHPRRRLANAIDGQVRTTGSDPRAQIVLRDDRVPVGMRPLIAYFTGKPRLRHPVMGNRSRWAGQSIEDVWWPVIKPHIGDYHRQVADAVGRVADKIERT